MLPTNIINDLRTETSLVLSLFLHAGTEDVYSEKKKDFINNPGIKA
jgi:hypothetical protein